MTVAPSVSVVIPTRNECENIGPLLDAVRLTLDGGDFEVVVVDDASSDGTAAVVADHARHHPNVRLLQRSAKLGLSSAVLDGSAQAMSGIVVMMDADFSHDPMLLPRLIREVQRGNDMAIGSRYVSGGRVVGWPIHRRIGSLFLTQFARLLFGLGAHDPLSGFVAFRRAVLQELPTRFSARGFKLLLETLVTGRSLRVVEVPMTFKDRTRGTSKLTVGEIWQFAALCYHLLRWRAGRRLRSLGLNAR